MVGTHLEGRESPLSYIRKKSSYNKLESECRSKGWSVIPLYVDVAALGHINTTWSMMSKAMGMTNNESKRSRLRCTKIALQLSHPSVPQANRMVKPTPKPKPSSNTSPNLNPNPNPNPTPNLKGRVGLAVPSRSYKHRQPELDPRIGAEKSF